ncbi:MULTISPECIES: uracil-DNA glycosylase [Acinetobacter]|uniref:Uracil-DNA glycosylase n=1 Tax=Acinetobacter pseudolwoffii TaxID=2053287 RepID=A0A2H9UIB6_9GAMM|nr:MULTISPECIES: uracil-DNA glycosylase [Acinetobacter]ENW23488.1 uracil-DNA glycosylase [Acinetobacter lwoffii NCTC 5866 = CIP 64.10 = NIPH 512]MCP0910185.1 uracil-DNA glycosylase [Acinetobacter pseudolwoffii]MDM1334805.1 uracil-DNA glycosylase [Acinetobacter pseudolwoffii]MDM1340383.1 uracil-DNA glycosylase [Acinetobacter pseudolwoffii]PJI31456.1 uracil-DNA glycosylase [Acinetobacter pseudolwoffii]
MSLNEQQLAKLNKVQLDESWKYGLSEFLLSPKMDELKAFLVEEKKADKTIYPPNHLIFNALNTTPLDRVKVVILGQDPYHGPNQAHGLSFSVQKGVALPPSLRNIFHELHADVGVERPKHGDLTHWAEQGVLLLNAVLTVEAGQPTSHQKRGWEEFTDHVIDVLNEQREHIVFILWGAYAQRKGQRINQDKHLVLKAAHPSPLAANRGGFFGCKVFSKSNNYLKQHGIEPIDWQLDA